MEEQWQRISIDDRKKFAHVCPIFILEIRSESDSLLELKNKMKEYMDNGCLLSWLIDPKGRKTHIFRASGKNEIVSFEIILTGEDVLPGFQIDLQKIFNEQL